MPQKPQPSTLKDGIDFAKNNLSNAKEGKEDTAKEGTPNFDFNAKTNLKR